MTSSPLKKFVLTPALLSAAVFATLTLPLAMLGSKPVSIQFQKEPVFQGQLRDVATPYLGLATVLSLSAGLAGVAVTGWQQSTRKSSQAEAQLSSLEQHLKEKEELLQSLKLSESRLEVAGLSAFVDEKIPLEEVVKTPVASQETVPVAKPPVITTQHVEPQPVAPQQVTVQAAAARFASAQTFLGYSQVKPAVKSENKATSPSSSEVEELHAQLQQIMVQMVKVQQALSTKQNEVKSEAQVSAQEQAAVPATWTPLYVVK